MYGQNHFLVVLIPFIDIASVAVVKVVVVVVVVVIVVVVKVIVFVAILTVFSRMHATLQKAMLVRRSVGWSVGWLHLFLIASFAVSRLAETYYCPCPTTRD